MILMMMMITIILQSLSFLATTPTTTTSMVASMPAFHSSRSASRDHVVSRLKLNSPSNGLSGTRFALLRRHHHVHYLFFNPLTLSTYICNVDTQA